MGRELWAISGQRSWSVEYQGVSFDLHTGSAQNLHAHAFYIASVRGQISEVGDWSPSGLPRKWHLRTGTAQNLRTTSSHLFFHGA